MIDFVFAPDAGTVVLLDDQQYELREARPASRNDGSHTVLLDWESICPVCGEAFVVTTGLKAKSLNRRCTACKNPNKPVKGKRGRKIKVVVHYA